MSLSSGSRLGPYEILAPIGAGGMGEVYRARDTNLGRDVAIKVLPDAFARDSDRMARFAREAKLLASLNHSNIASIYGLETSGNSRALVMELAEGPTLGDRIAQGPIPIEDSLRIAKQICDALEYAHEKGIIHRDLKPANIKVAADDTVKILDFGLAKAMESGPSTEDIANSPTLSQMATQAGVLLGTAAYMSPEQAKAKPVDRRADIWAFGCVLYEMLTGTRAFQGDSVADALAAVIRNVPDWSRLPAATPMRIRVLLQRCLQKDPKQRLQAIGDARISLDEVLSGAPEGLQAIVEMERSSQPWRKWLGWGTAGVFVLATALFAFLYFRQRPSVGHAMRFEIPLPEKISLGNGFELSPDGRELAFIGTGADNQSRIWVRAIDSLEAHQLEGTDGATGRPFWSPDSRYIAYQAQGKLRKIESTGGPPLAICDAPAVVQGGSWNNDDVIIFGTPTGVMRVDASGGTSSAVTTDGASLVPAFLPDGRHFVYFHPSTQGVGVGTFVSSLGTKGEVQSSKKLLTDFSFVAYTPSADSAVGYLLFVRGSSAYGSLGTLMAQHFDTRRLELTGEAVPLAERVSNVGFSASTADSFAYVHGTEAAPVAGVRGIIQGQLTWFDRSGKSLAAFGDVGTYRTLALSPDGKYVAFERGDPQNNSVRNLWLYEFARGVTTRFTFSSSWDQYPVWSPDGSRIAFTSSRAGPYDLYEKTSNLAGDAELLFRSNDVMASTSWSPDGRFLLYFTINLPNRLWLLPLAGSAGDRKAVRVDDSKFNETIPSISPDGRWVAYTSNESGQPEVYVRPLKTDSVAASPSAGPMASGKWMVSKGGGGSPLWRRDGKELFYLSSIGGTAMAVDVSTSGVFHAGIPKPLFKVPAGVLFWNVTANGQRFLMAAPSTTGSAEPPTFTLVLNWQAVLKK
jgi:Tol biopolymer transport system component